MAGLTSSGFDIKTLDAILSDMETVELAQISTTLDVNPTSIIGVLNGIMAQAVFELWQLAGALYNGMDPDEAITDQLTGLALLSGTVRLGAEATQALGVTVNLNNGFSAAPGTMFASIINNPQFIFTNKATVANSSGITANVTADFVCTQTGPIPCNGSTLSVIATPLSGWNSVLNSSGSTIVGNNGETDPLLRIRRNSELSSAGAATGAAISGDILRAMVVPTTSSDTLACTVLYNDTNATDANGLPAHSIEVIAYQPGSTSADDQLLANLILASKSAGIGTYSGGGTTVVKTVVDSQGISESITFTRPATTALTIAITIKQAPGHTVTAAQVQNALVAFASNTYSPGVEVYYLALQASVFPEPNNPAVGVPGVADVTTFTVNGGTSNIVIDPRHVATLIAGGITVTIT